MLSVLEEMSFPVLVVIATSFLALFIELGYLAGKLVLRLKGLEKESSVSSISGYVLALLAFILAFSFGIVTDRYDTRKALVLEEANLIRTTWFQTDFLPDSARSVSRNLLREYVDIRVKLVNSNDLAILKESLVRSIQIQENLWQLLLMNDDQMNSDQASLLATSLNDMTNIHESRVVVGLHLRIPSGIWSVLIFLIWLGMFVVGYQASIAGSGRTWANIILALSFALVLSMIAMLDSSRSKFIPVSQFPLENLLNYMNGSGPIE
jgi:hypothetical protein